MRQKRILITGITGQDGSYMAEYCLEKGHKVYGMVRLTSSINDRNFAHLYSNPNFSMVRGDLLDSHSLEDLVKHIAPNAFINLAAQSFVGNSWQVPEETFNVDAVGVLKCLEAIKKHAPDCRFYNAGSSEQFGDVVYTPQSETHPFRPRSPYGAAKCAAHFLVKVYRESYGLYAVQGLLFNHESERRGEHFVTRKITKGVARIKQSLLSNQTFEPIELGNIYAKRDWSHAADFVDGIWRMLYQEEHNEELKEVPYHEGGSILLPFAVDTKNCQVLSKHIKEYVLASGETHTIKEFIEKAFEYAGFVGYWEGEGLKERFIININGAQALGVVINESFYRPCEVDVLLGDSTLARKELGWKPKISFDNLVKCMVLSDIEYERKKASQVK